MNIIKRLVLFFILLLTSIIHGQTCDFRILGIVKDLHDGEPIFGAVVEIKGTDFYGQTNKEGYFELTGICEGSVQIIVSHIQCNPVERSLTIESDVELSFALEHHINELEEIILIENGITQVNTSVSESQMNADQLARMSNQSLAETLNVLPGVSALKTGNSIAKPMIHGLYGSRVAIIANGMRLQDQEWGADHAPNIDLNGFESVQVVKGAAALKYGGDASGGMIVLSPQRIRLKDSLYGNTILNGVDNGKGGGLSSRLTKSYDNGFYFSGQLATKYFGDRQAPDYFLTNTALKAMQNIDVDAKTAFGFGRTNLSPDDPNLKNVAIAEIMNDIGSDESKLRSIMATKFGYDYDKFEQMLGDDKEANMQEMLRDAAEEIYTEDVVPRYFPKSKTVVRDPSKIGIAATTQKLSVNERQRAEIQKRFQILPNPTSENIKTFTKELEPGKSVDKTADGNWYVFNSKGEAISEPIDFSNPNVAKAQLARHANVAGFEFKSAQNQDLSQYNFNIQ